MTAVGIVVEYNPFHNGHKHHIEQAKKITGADTVIAVMSGNFVQRGIPASADKWQRTQFAIENGVDIVIELPVYFALQPGDIFAKGALQLLNAMGVNDIVFGAENPEVDFVELAKKANEIEDEEFTQEGNQTYASAFAQRLQEATGFDLSKSNDILAFSYAKAVVELELDDKITLHPISRKQAEYNDDNIQEGQEIASATAIRKAVDEGADVSGVTPMKNLFARSDYEGKLFDLLNYRIASDGVKQLKQVYQMNEGMEYRLKDVVETGVASYEELLAQIKSKRYTAARIHRTLMYTLLNIKVDQMQAAMKEPYVRLLGFSQQGQTYLNENKKNITLPLISHVDLKLAKSNLRLDYRAGVIYNQIMGLTQDQDVGRIPVNTK